MSKLDELLKGVDVEWLPLGDVCKIIGRIGYRGYTKKDIVENKDGAIALSPSNIINDKINYEKLTFINWDKYYESPEIMIHNGDIIFCKTASVGKTAYVEDLPYLATLNPQLVVFKEIKCLSKFLSYCLKTENFKISLNKIIGLGSVPSISQKDLSKLKIPIPCPDNPEKSLEIQQEIVRVLDELTSLSNQLTTELETERQNRKKQFEFFREQLFSFEEGSIIFNKLGDIGEFQRGKRFVKTDMISEGVPCIHYGEMYTHYGIWANETKSFLSKELVDTKKLRLAKKNDVIMVAAGETIEDIGKGTSWLSDQGVVFHDACFSFTSPLNPSYVAYFTRTKQFHDQIRRNISSGKISAINSKGLEKVYIPIPPLAEQERIVKLLDQFDATHTAIEEEITKEIKLRTQQYEYYREKLLSFPSLRTT
ncbi:MULTISPECIES: restriction endonuclease subunit S [unclassified Empedobacter]|uniref:restriction endonuclease subunit S n=1 Tax=unclassified Empedobacter TaxID=2643773 RepID=UPI0025BA5006|nr:MULTISPECIES: restriction endonuclease subunit S [unclassified Empedobacter]